MRPKVRESHGNVYYPPAFAKLVASPPSTHTERAGSGTGEGSRHAPSHFWADEPQAWPGERAWLRLCRRYPRAAPAVALALIAAFLMAAFLLGGAR